MVSSRQAWLDAGSWLSGAGGGRQGWAEASVIGPTRKLPVTPGTVGGSAVKGTMEKVG